MPWLSLISSEPHSREYFYSMYLPQVICRRPLIMNHFPDFNEHTHTERERARERDIDRDTNTDTPTQPLANCPPSLRIKNWSIFFVQYWNFGFSRSAYGGEDKTWFQKFKKSRFFRKINMTNFFLNWTIFVTLAVGTMAIRINLEEHCSRFFQFLLFFQKPPPPPGITTNLATM